MTENDKDEAVRTNLTKAAQLNLYSASRSLNHDTEKRVGLTISCQTYVQDPLVAAGEAKLGIKEVELQWEPGLAAGPTSSRLAVVDYNADTGALTAPAEWDDDQRLFLGPGRTPLAVGTPSDPQFRQVNVWAIVQRVLEFYQSPQVMGRPIPWGIDGNRLIVVPAAGWGENAFYDRESKSLQFYYFGDSAELRYTCLSHDIVAHETGHALLDGIRPFYYQHTSVQTTAFHEFVADLTAILTALRHNELRQVVVALAGSEEEAVLVELIGNLAEEFGKHVTDRPYLRSAGVKKTMQQAAGDTVPHSVSEVLTGAVFQIFVRLAKSYLDRTLGSGKRATASQALWWAFQRVSATALQALDLCPPVDIQFIDYVRACLRCDELSDPVDEKGYRQVMRDVFHEWGFCREGCDGGDDCELTVDVRELATLRRKAIYRSIDRISRSRTEAYYYINDNREALEIPLSQDLSIVDLYETNKLDPSANRLPTQIVLEYVWEEAVPLEGERFGELAGKVAQLLCGGTIVFDDRGNLLSLARKAPSEERKQLLLAHYADRIKKGLVSDPDDSLGVVLAGSKPISATVSGDTVRLEATAHLRDVSPEAENEVWTASF
jgi:hypothetical protein